MLGILTRSIPMFLVMASFAHAQETKETFKPPAYQKLRYDENYSYLADPTKRTDFWDAIKYILLTPANDLWVMCGFCSCPFRSMPLVSSDNPVQSCTG